MPVNLEVKARSSPGAGLLAAELTGRHAPDAVLLQEDTYFTVREGRLKLREIAGATAELIAYERPEKEGARLSAYRKMDVADPALLKEMLSRTLGVRGIVSKRRELYLYNSSIRIHIDEVKELGHFVEIEVPREGDDGEGEGVMAFLIGRLGLHDFVAGSYIDMLAAGPASG